MFGYSHQQVLWDESWASLNMKISDKPRYESTKGKVRKLKTKEEIVKYLSKYVKNDKRGTS
jgi:hypothetical protein